MTPQALPLLLAVDCFSWREVDSACRNKSPQPGRRFKEHRMTGKFIGDLIGKFRRPTPALCAAAQRNGAASFGPSRARSGEIASPLRRHARACRGHPRLSCGLSAAKTWMAGTSPAMTPSKWFSLTGTPSSVACTVRRSPARRSKWPSRLARWVRRPGPCRWRKPEPRRPRRPYSRRSHRTRADSHCQGAPADLFRRPAPAARRAPLHLAFQSDRVGPFLHDRLWGREDQGHQQNQLHPACLADQAALAILPVLEVPLGRAALGSRRDPAVRQRPADLLVLPGPPGRARDHTRSPAIRANTSPPEIQFAFSPPSSAVRIEYPNRRSQLPFSATRFVGRARLVSVRAVTALCRGGCTKRRTAGRT
jgi:hypothetical protein